MKPSRSWLLVLAVFTLLALDFAAFDDISTGVESNYTAEAAIILLSIPFLAGIYLLTKKVS